VQLPLLFRKPQPSCFAASPYHRGRHDHRSERQASSRDGIDVRHRLRDRARASRRGRIRRHQRPQPRHREGGATATRERDPGLQRRRDRRRSRQRGGRDGVRAARWGGRHPGEQSRDFRAVAVRGDHRRRLATLLRYQCHERSALVASLSPGDAGARMGAGRFHLQRVGAEHSGRDDPLRDD